MDNVTSASKTGGSSHAEGGFSAAIFTMGAIYGFGVVGNLVVLVTFIWSRKLRTPQNSFIMTLAVADLLALSQCPLVMKTMWKGYQFYGKDICLLSASLTAFSYTASIASIMMVAVGRYVSIVKLGLKERIFTWPRCALIQVCIFAHSMLSVAPVWSTWLKEAQYIDVVHICLISGENTIIYDVLMSVFALAIPVGVVLYAYLQIYLTFRKSKNSVKAHGRWSSVTNARDSAKQKRELRLAVQLFLIFSFFCVSWTPFTLLVLLDRKSALPEGLYQFFQQLLIANSAVNPPIYFYFNTVYRAELLRLFRLDRTK